MARAPSSSETRSGLELNVRPGEIEDMSQVLRISRYWFRATFARSWPGYLAVVLMIGLVGGIAIGSLSGARRTESSFSVFLASTNPSDMHVFLYAPNQTTALSHLALVRHVANATYGINAFPAGRDGAPRIPTAVEDGDVAGVGSVEGEFFTQDKVAVVSGRMADPKKADEFVMSVQAEQLMGWHVGQSIPMYFYTDAQSSLPTFGTAKVKPTVMLTMHLVGTVVLNNEVVSDETAQFPALMIFTPALSRPFAEAGESYGNYALQLDHGARDVSKVEREIIGALPPGTTYTFLVTAVTAGDVNRSVEPVAIALGVFGLIAALAVFVIAGGLISRALQREDDDIEILRALGADPSTTVSVGLFGLLGAVVVGALLAVIVGVALSPLSPLGPVRPVYPDRGIAFDWTVLGVGFLLLVVGLGTVAFILARRRARHHLPRRTMLVVPVGSRVARWFAGAGFSPAAVVGVRFALEPGQKRDAVPVRSALLGAVLAVMVVVATLTFGASLHTLISRPPLYGWNWNDALGSSNNIPPQSTALLNRDPFVAAWSGANLADAQINGVTVPIMLVGAHAKVAPPLLSGHEVDSVNQIVLGAETMQQLHKHVGQTVIASYGTPKDAPVYVPPSRLTIVGTSTLPAVGGSLTLHTSMGIGALIDVAIEPPAFRKVISSPDPTLNGWQFIMVRLKSDASQARAWASLQRIVEAGDRAFAKVPDGAGAGDAVAALRVRYPAEIENYRSIGEIPALLALGLAAGAVAALGLTLVASVRRRRRDLALLRTLGFTQRQLGATIAWQASVAGSVGVVLGVPLGVVAGEWLWTLFARRIYAVPEPTVPWLSLLVVVLSTLVLVNVVAALPGRKASRTSTARVLRGE
jgi:hypothetical protein